MKLKEIVILACLGAASLSSQPSLSQEAIRDSSTSQKQGINDLEARKKQVEDLFQKTSWGWWMGQPNYVEPGEKDASEVSKFGDLAIDYCMEYSRGNLSQRKTAMRALRLLGEQHINIDRARDTVLRVWEDGNENYYVRGLARDVFFYFGKEGLLNLLGNISPEVKILAIESLGQHYGEDSDTLKRLGELIKERNADAKVRAAATVYGTPREQRLERILHFIEDSNEPVLFRQELLTDSLPNYLSAVRSERKQEELPIQQYEALRGTVARVSRGKELQAALQGKPFQTLVGIDEELCELYFKRARVYIDKGSLEAAKGDIHSAMVLAGKMPDKKRQEAFESGISTTGWNYPGGYHPRETRAIFNELLLGEASPNMRRALREGMDYIDDYLKKYPVN